MGFTWSGPLVIDYLWLVAAALFLIIVFWKIKGVRMVFGLLTIIFLANFLTLRLTPNKDSVWLNNFAYKNSVGSYVVVENPTFVSSYQKFLVESQDSKIKGRAIVYTKKYPEFQFGDVLKIEGEIIPLGQETILKSQKNQAAYSKIYMPKKIERLSEAPSSFWVKLRVPFVKIEKKMEAQITRLIVQPEAGLLAGILLGVKTNIAEDVRKILSLTGTAHIIALSGYNITIIAESLNKVLRFRSRNVSFLLPVAGIFSFVLATGFSASVVRAAIMGIMLLLAKRLGRSNDSMVSILLVSSLMAAFNPYIILYDIGFQLSFMALIGIIYLAPLIEGFFVLLGQRLSQIILSTLAAQIMTLPLISYYFGEISLVSPLANMSILPLIPFLMFYSFICLLISFFSLSLAKFLALGSYYILNYFLNSLRFWGVLKQSALSYKINSVLVLIGIYLIIFELMLIMQQKRKKNASFS